MGSNTPSSPGNFSYPPPGSRLQFNYMDSVVISWLVFDSHPTDCTLSLWYWPNTDPWVKGMCQSVLANGTEIIPLDFAVSSYTGQLNFNYTASDGIPQKIISPFFYVDNSPHSRAVTWRQGVLALPTSSASSALQTSSASSALQTSISASLVTLSASPATTTTANKPPSVLYSSATSSSLSVSKPSSTNGSDLGIGAIAGIVVGIVVCAGLAAGIIFYRLRKPNSVQAEVRSPSPASFRSPVPANFIGEKDGSPLRPKELPGDGHLLEMATDNH